MVSRRTLLQAVTVCAARAAAPLHAGLRLGAMDVVLRLSSKPEAVGIAKRLGLEGLQVTLGRTPDSGGLLLDDPALQAAFRGEVRKHALPLNATYLDLLHTHCLKNSEKAQALVSRGIDVTRRLDARVLMTVFFGPCAINTPQERDYVADVFRELAPEAQRAGVVIGFENVLRAEDNVRVLDRVASDAFKVYYDVGNATNLAGVDAAKEIRFLGRNRICQFHFKDKGYLGQGAVDFPAVMAAVTAIGFRGYANLETSSPSGSMEDDLKKNLAFLRGLERRAGR